MERIIFFSCIISIVLVYAEASCWGVPGKGKIFARKTNLIFCSFVSLFVPFENFSPIWRRHHCRWRAAKFDVCSALTAIEQWGFFSVLHVLWHGASFYSGLRGPVTLTPIAERCYHLCLRLGSVAAGIWTAFRLQGEQSNWLRHLR